MAELSAAAESDTLRVWVQHYAPGGYVDPRVFTADAVLACFPDAIPPHIRLRHLLPMGVGEVYIYYQDRATILVTDTRQPILDHAIRGESGAP